MSTGPHRQAQRRALPPSSSPLIASTEYLLNQGGDPRIAIDPASGRTRYLCASAPQVRPGFGSSTASVVSPRGFAAADRLRSRLAVAASHETLEIAYARELQRMRGELAALCGLDDMAGLEVLFAASGTDIHLVLSQLLCAGRDRPTFAIGLEPGETGSGVPQALRGSHFSSRTAMGREVCEGATAGGAGVTQLIAITARQSDGTPRAAGLVAAELEAAVTHFAASGHVLLTVTDLSKTGLLSFDLAQVLHLRRRFPGRVDVLVDACQFRLSAASLRAYLEQDCLVAVTGSKFLGGPTFSGALLIPPAFAARLAAQPAPPGLDAYLAAADLPAGWRSSQELAPGANPGLLLRWEAALAELRAFRAVPDWKVARTLQAFARTTLAGLAADPVFEHLPTPRPDRRVLGDAGWDAVPTIFPFLLRRPHGRYFTAAETMAVYRTLGAEGLLIGQPVACGARDGGPISALRFCASARLVTDAQREQGAGEAAMLQAATEALAQVAEVARRA